MPRSTCFSNLARPERLELPTYWFEASRSIQLSYGRATDIIAATEFTAFEPVGRVASGTSAGRLTCRRPCRPVDSTAELTPAPRCHFVTHGNACRRQDYESAGRKHCRYLLLQLRHFGQRIANNVRSLTDWIRR